MKAKTLYFYNFFAQAKLGYGIPAVRSNVLIRGILVSTDDVSMYSETFQPGLSAHTLTTKSDVLYPLEYSLKFKINEFLHKDRISEYPKAVDVIISEVKFMRQIFFEEKNSSSNRDNFYPISSFEPLRNVGMVIHKVFEM